jgi:hypothetical protein
MRHIPYIPKPGEQIPQPVEKEPCHRCNGTGKIVRYRVDGSIKSERSCPCGATPKEN